MESMDGCISIYKGAGSLTHSILLGPLPAVGRGEDNIHRGTESVPDVDARAIRRTDIGLDLLLDIAKVIGKYFVHGNIIRDGWQV